jgi:hypothetical protein
MQGRKEPGTSSCCKGPSAFLKAVSNFFWWEAVRTNSGWLSFESSTQGRSQEASNFYARGRGKELSAPLKAGREIPPVRSGAAKLKDLRFKVEPRQGRIEEPHHTGRGKSSSCVFQNWRISKLEENLSSSGHLRFLSWTLGKPGTSSRGVRQRSFYAFLKLEEKFFQYVAVRANKERLGFES